MHKGENSGFPLWCPLKCPWKCQLPICSKRQIEFQELLQKKLKARQRIYSRHIYIYFPVSSSSPITFELTDPIQANLTEVAISNTFKFQNLNLITRHRWKHSRGLLMPAASEGFFAQHTPLSFKCNNFTTSAVKTQESRAWQAELCNSFWCKNSNSPHLINMYVSPKLQAYLMSVPWLSSLITVYTSNKTGFYL